MTPVLLSSIAGVTLSLLFAYMPGLKTWFGKQDGTKKRLIMAGLLGVSAVGAFGVSCYQPTTILDNVICTEAGALELVGVYIVALVANQGTYSLAVPKSG